MLFETSWFLGGTWKKKIRLFFFLKKKDGFFPKHCIVWLLLTREKDNPKGWRSMHLNLYSNRSSRSTKDILLGSDRLVVLNDIAFYCHGDIFFSLYLTTRARLCQFRIFHQKRGSIFFGGRKRKRKRKSSIITCQSYKKIHHLLFPLFYSTL